MTPTFAIMLKRIKAAFAALFQMKTCERYLRDQLEDAQRGRLEAYKHMEDWAGQVQVYETRIARVSKELKAMDPNLPTLN